MLYVLDGSYYIFRAFYAVRGMRNSKGMPTNGLYAFTNMLMNVIRDDKPEHIVVAFDPPGGSFRNQLFEDYKANRDEPPEDLVPQFPHFRRIVDALSIPVLEAPGFEADDVIGTVVRRAEAAGLEVTILSGDKDLCQLLGERTTMLDSMRSKRFDVATVHERFQVGPDRVADVLGLAGDTSDNIPGVPGIGEKTAGKLVAEFGSLEEVLANVDRVSGAKRKQNLLEHADMARLSLELATIRTDVPIVFDLDRYALTAPDFVAFDELCVEFEFRRFSRVARELFEEESREAAEATAAEREYRAVQSREDLAACVAEIVEAGSFAIEVQTTGQDALDAHVTGVGLAWRPGAAVYVPVGHIDLMGGTQLPLDVVLAELRGPLEDPAVAVVARDAKFCLKLFARHGVGIANVAFDTTLGAYLLDPNKRSYGNDLLARELLDERTIALSDIAGTGRKRRRLEEVAIELATPYGAEQADVTLRVAAAMEAKLEDPLAEVLRDIELPLSRVLARVEATGIRVDRDFLGELSTELGGRVAEISVEVFAHAGSEFTLNSPQQLARVLFGDLGLPVKKKTKTGPSTDHSVLEALEDAHPIIPLVIEYRELSKLASTYVDALPRLIRPGTGRVHTHFNQSVAATGRLSSSDPNLQNIPIRRPEGRRIRRAFVPKPGWVLFGGDYSQIELRVLAHMSEEPVLIDAFDKGEDIHTRTAAEVFEVGQGDVDKAQRSAAKAINFGLIYGMGVNRLSRELGIPRDDAKEYIERYFARIERVQPFMEELIESAQTKGYAETLFGRRRPIPELVGATSGRAYALGERLAKNTPIQGTAADIIKVAMIRIQDRLDDAGLETRMLLSVHDELVFECPPAELESAMALVRSEMESVVELRVPLTVDLSSGASWAELK